MFRVYCMGIGCVRNGSGGAEEWTSLSPCRQRLRGGPLQPQLRVQAHLLRHARAVLRAHGQHHAAAVQPVRLSRYLRAGAYIRSLFSST